MKRFKSAITGEFVTKKFAKENPETTVEMTMDNSQAVIEKLQADKEELLEALEESNLQIEYLQEKFKETGSGNALISRNKSLIQKHKQCGTA